MHGCHFQFYAAQPCVVCPVGHRLRVGREASPTLVRDRPPGSRHPVHLGNRMCGSDVTLREEGAKQLPVTSRESCRVERLARKREKEGAALLRPSEGHPVERGETADAVKNLERQPPRPLRRRESGMLRQSAMKQERSHTVGRPQRS